jgi:hypothetical protein
MSINIHTYVEIFILQEIKKHKTPYPQINKKIKCFCNAGEGKQKF